MLRFTLFGSRLLFWLTAPWVMGGMLFFPYLSYQSFLANDVFGIIIGAMLSLCCFSFWIIQFLPSSLRLKLGVIWRGGRMDFDFRILEAIQGSTPDNPRDLATILGYVDFVERVGLSHAELAGGLSRLIKKGRIAELPGHRFYELTQASELCTFSGITEEDHRQAHSAYAESLRKKCKEWSKK